MLDLRADIYPQMSFDRFNWLLNAGVPAETLTRLTPLHVATGRRAKDGIFEDAEGDRSKTEGGHGFLVFEEAEDLVFWQPRTGEIATALNRAFALGEDNIYNPGTYSFDCHLNIFPDPLEWLQNRCDGCVVLDWSRAFDRLRDCPRIAISESLLFLYRRHMRPPHMPDVSVVTTRKAAAA